MALASAQWRRCGIHEVVLAWLRAEREHFVEELPADVAVLDALIRDPADLGDADANHRRMRLLYRRRAGMLVELPVDTEWYEVRHLTDDDIGALRVAGRCGWDDPRRRDGNELARVIPRMRARGVGLELRRPSEAWDAALVLWGHGRAGPFTILEGNHRLLAYVAAGARGMCLPAYVGLSESYLVHHLPDPVTGPLVPRG